MATVQGPNEDKWWIS